MILLVSCLIFYFKSGRQRYKFIVLGHELTYFVKHKMKGRKCYTENEVIIMLKFLIYNIFGEFVGNIFQQIIGIPVGTDCTPLLSYNAEFIQKLIKDKKIIQN